MTRVYERHLLFFFLLIFVATHLYFVFDHYMEGYNKLIEIWVAIFKFFRFIITG